MRTRTEEFYDFTIWIGYSVGWLFTAEGNEHVFIIWTNLFNCAEDNYVLLFKWLRQHARDTTSYLWDVFTGSDSYENFDIDRLCYSHIIKSWPERAQKLLEVSQKLADVG